MLRTPHGRLGSWWWLLCLLVLAASSARSDTDFDHALAVIDSLWYAGQADQAHHRITTELNTARAGVDSLHLFELLSRQGTMWSAMGQGADAKPVLAEALLLGRRLGPPRVTPQRVVGTLRWLGVAHYVLAEFTQGRDTFAEMLDAARRCADRDQEAWALTGLAFYEKDHGEPVRAAELYQQSVDLFAEIEEPRGEIFALNGLGTTYYHIGAYDDARRCYERTATLGRRLGRAFTTALAENNLGALEFSLGDPGRAVAHFREAARLQLADGAHREHILPLMQLARARSQLGNQAEAEQELRRLLAECREHGYRDLQQALERELASVLHASGRLHEAEQVYLGLLAQPPENLSDRCGSVLDLVRLQRDLGHVDEALAILDQDRSLGERTGSPTLAALYDLEYGLTLLDLGRIGPALAALSIADSTVAHLGQDRIRLRTLTALAAARRRLDDPQGALADLETAAELWLTDRRLPVDPEWREALGQWTRRFSTDLAWLRWQQATSVGQEAAAVFATIQTFKARTLLERTLGPGRRLIEHVQTGDLPDLAHLQRRVLRPGEVLLDFLVGSDRSLLVAVSTERTRVVELPAEAELRRRVGLLRDLILSTSADTSSLAAIDLGGAALRKTLLEPVADLVDQAEHLFLSPDGMLHLLPWSVLLDSPEAARTWSVIPSVAMLAGQRAGSTGPHHDLGPRLLALAGRDSTTGRTPAGIAAEIATLTHDYSAVTVARLDAGVVAADLVPAWSAYDILHFAAHSSANDQAPWNSSLYLAAAGDDSTAVRIPARDIAAEQLDTDLVVLASCQSVAGRAPAGEGPQGLASAFLSAGVPAVVATLWPVDDAATAACIRHFYTRLAGSGDGAEALAYARNQVRANPATRHPRYWAGFVLVGDGSDLPRPAVRADRRRQAVAVGLAVLVLVAGLLVLAARRRPSAKRAA